MGLDMYLTVEHKLSTEQKEKINEIIGFTNLQDSLSVKTLAIYWRNANAIHNWFVTNVQNGVDDCKEYYVFREQLVELLKEITAVLAREEGSENLLTPTAGFFFESIDKDEWYWHDLNRTKEELTELLNSPHTEFYYQSSW